MSQSGGDQISAARVSQKGALFGNLSRQFGFAVAAIGEDIAHYVDEWAHIIVRRSGPSRTRSERQQLLLACRTLSGQVAGPPSDRGKAGASDALNPRPIEDQIPGRRQA